MSDIIRRVMVILASLSRNRGLTADGDVVRIRHRHDVPYSRIQQRSTWIFSRVVPVALRPS
jgi:hypothetical protein